MTLQLNGFYKFFTCVHRIFPLSTFSNWAQHLLNQNTNFRFWTQVHHVVAISETKWFATCACFDEPTVQLQAFFICDACSTSGIQPFVFFIQKISKCSQKASVLQVQVCRTFSLLPAASRWFLWITAASKFNKSSLLLQCICSAFTHWAQPTSTRLFGRLFTKYPHTVQNYYCYGLHRNATIWTAKAREHFRKVLSQRNVQYKKSYN